MQYGSYYIFDMDGTLIDSMGIWDGIPARILARYGKAPTPGLRARLLPLTVTQTAQLMIDEYTLPLSCAEFIALTQEEVRRAYLAVAAKPGAAELLARLHAGGAALCVASSTPQPLCEAVLTRLGLAQHLAFIASCDGGPGKEKPDFYLACMRRLGAGVPDEVTVVEDTLHAVRTAHAAGFRVVAVADAASAAHKDKISALADRYVTTLKELG